MQLKPRPTGRRGTQGTRPDEKNRTGIEKLNQTIDIRTTTELSQVIKLRTNQTIRKTVKSCPYRMKEITFNLDTVRSVQMLLHYSILCIQH